MSTVETCVGLGSSKDLLGDVQGGGAGDLNLAQVQVQTCSFLSGLTCIPSSCRNIATRPTLDRSDPSWDISIAKISGLPFVGGFGADSGQRPKHPPCDALWIGFSCARRCRRLVYLSLYLFL